MLPLEDSDGEPVNFHPTLRLGFQDGTHKPTTTSGLPAPSQMTIRRFGCKAAPHARLSILLGRRRAGTTA